jgi:hypothetical protein
MPAHGTVSGYNTGCRCDFCREAIADYRRARRRGDRAALAATRSREAGQVPLDCAPRSEIEDRPLEKHEGRHRARGTTPDVLGPILSDLARALARSRTQGRVPVARTGPPGRPTPRPSPSPLPLTAEGVCSTCRVYREACGASYCPLPPAQPAPATCSPITTGRLDDWPAPPSTRGLVPELPPRPPRRTLRVVLNLRRSPAYPGTT